MSAEKESASFKEGSSWKVLKTSLTQGPLSEQPEPGHVLFLPGRLGASELPSAHSQEHPQLLRAPLSIRLG